MTIKLLFIILFILWSFPLGYFRNRFRKMVYETDSWWINIKPVFLKELKVLFGFYDSKVFPNPKPIYFYRFYLAVYFVLLIVIYNT
jgi:peroxiredoxin Q/BCP